MTTTSELRTRWETRYQSGPTPWDTGITPPEVVDFWRSGRLSPSGLAVDVGSGSATNALYLARLGLRAVALDIAALALHRGLTRLQQREASLRSRTHLIQATATAIPLPQGCAQYVLDVGCFHSLPLEARPGYANEIIEVTAPGGYYHLYAFDESEETTSGARGVGDDEVQARFAPGFEVAVIDRATPNPRPCRWYLLRRR